MFLGLREFRKKWSNPYVIWCQKVLLTPTSYDDIKVGLCMNKKLIIFAAVYIVIIAVICGMMTAYISSKYNSQRSKDKTAGLIVELNEVKNLIESNDYDAALDKCDEIVETPFENEDKDLSQYIIWMWIFAVVNIISVFMVLIYVNARILKPFADMKNYASEIAKGNLEVGVKAERGNYFGDFTWAFDNMRKEIIKARSQEKIAIENNKTIIATLSHDIKTPMASIRAYAEAFEANMDSTPEKKQKYLTVLIQKCDEVTKLTNDLFLHSISEMNRLDVKKEEIELSGFLNNEVRGLFVDESAVDITIPDKEIIINADSKRLLQIFENLKNNAEKYARTKVDIYLENTSDEAADKERGTSDTGLIRIHFRDYGPGIPEEEIPFITGKFYRGRNAGNESGTGLGLYIVSELVQKMNGKLILLNKNPGLDAVLEIKK
ncbi:MAG TPA: sensor histidine kinase [Lachnospiraceae bacterium]|nr:sensor histidine kinase [Lachnospiraceae bacterium]